MAFITLNQLPEEMKEHAMAYMGNRVHGRETYAHAFVADGRCRAIVDSKYNTYYLFQCEPGFFEPLIRVIDDMKGPFK